MHMFVLCGHVQCVCVSEKRRERERERTCSSECDSTTESLANNPHRDADEGADEVRSVLL